MKKMILFFGIVMMSIPIFANEYAPNYGTEVVSEYAYTEIEDECTVALTATVYGVSVSVSVTAVSCTEAGSGAVESLIAAVKKIRDEIQK